MASLSSSDIVPEAGMQVRFQEQHTVNKTIFTIATHCKTECVCNQKGLEIPHIIYTDGGHDYYSNYYWETYEVVTQLKITESSNRLELICQSD